MSWDELLDILYEDNHCLAINKPAGWASAHESDKDSLDAVTKDYLRQKYAKTGNVFLGVVHRLDKPTSGVLLFARTSKAAARLSEQFREGAIDKVYWAVVVGFSGQPAGSLSDWLSYVDGRAIIDTADTPDAQSALTYYTVLRTHENLTMLELRPQTGRKHQLRIQLASRGWPIVGDRKYHSALHFAPGIALHSRQLTFLHPTRRDPITLVAEVPRSWRGRFAYLLAGLT